MELTWEAVEAFVGGTIVPAEAPILDDFLRLPVVTRLVDVAVKTLCRRYGINHAVYAEDFTAEVNALIFLVLTSQEWADRARMLSDFPRGIYHLSQSKFKQITESASWVGSSGMSTQVRRQRAIAAFRARFVRDFEREPSSRELVEAYNTAIVTTRKDAARQGMIATEADLRPIGPVSLDAPAAQDAASFDTYPILTPTAGPLVREIITRATVEDPLLGAVARSWLGGYQDEVFATVKAISADLGLGPVEVVEAQKAIQAITVLVLRDLGMPD